MKTRRTDAEGEPLKSNGSIRDPQAFYTRGIIKGAVLQENFQPETLPSEESPRHRRVITGSTRPCEQEDPTRSQSSSLPINPTLRTAIARIAKSDSANSWPR